MCFFPYIMMYCRVADQCGAKCTVTAGRFSLCQREMVQNWKESWVRLSYLTFPPPPSHSLPNFPSLFLVSLMAELQGTSAQAQRQVNTATLCPGPNLAQVCLHRTELCSVDMPHMPMGTGENADRCIIMSSLWSRKSLFKVIASSSVH